jgi:hypothetical protein
MLRSILLLTLVALCFRTTGATLDLSSPDRTVQLQLATDTEGHLVYTVRSGGHVRLGPSRAGVIVDNSDLGASAQIVSSQTRTISEVFAWRGNKTSATNRCQATEVRLRSGANGVEWILEGRIFNDGMGFRYRVPGAGSRRVNGESTSWLFPGEAVVWYQTDTSNYEGAYHHHRADSIPAEENVRGKQRPTHLGLPATLEYADGSFGMVSEAALVRYSGLTLRRQGDAVFTAAFEDDPDGWRQEGEIVSPWRVIVLSRDLNGLVNSDLIAALNEPPDPQLFPQGMNTEWIKPGKAPCTWMVYGNDGAQWDKQKWFVDVAAATGCEYLLVDAGWRTEKWGWMRNGGDLWGRAAELCQYAAERNVGIVLWHAYPEGRDDGPGLTTVEGREELFRNCQKAGVKGIKIDFFDSESRAVIDAYEDLARRSAKYQLMINFHGANKPTGEARTWPNEVTREGIREQEYLLWDTIPLEHYGALPFTRMAAGHADFLPGYVQERFLKNTTVIFQMASTIVFTSPFLCWPDNPEAYLHSPLLQFVRALPVTWDETRILPGSAIGNTVLMARRKGAEWYLAALNCRPESRQLDLDLSFADLSGKELTLYRDGANNPACVIEAGVKPSADAKLSVELRPGGGFIAHIAAPKRFTGWK